MQKSCDKYLLASNFGILSSTPNILKFNSNVIFLNLLALVLTPSICSTQVLNSSQNFPLVKCFNHQLGKQRSLTFPGIIMTEKVYNATFRLQDKCATRLPHCMKTRTNEEVRKTLIYSEIGEEREPLFKITPTGFLQFGVDFFSTEEYCVYKSTKDILSVQISRPDCENTHVCVPKCCSADKVLDFDLNSCQHTQRIWEPLVYKAEDLQVCGEKRANIRFHYYMNSNMRLCHKKDAYLLKSVEGDLEKFRVKFRLLQDGSVVLKELLSRDWKRPERGQYCLDGVQNFGEYKGPFMGDPLDQILFICEGNSGGIGEGAEAESQLTVLGILYCILLFSGTPFLLMTVIVYLLVWGKQNVHGRTLFSHTLAVLLNYLGQGVTNTVSRLYNSSDNASTSCAVIGVFNHYFVLATFCWMTMINYDLWSKFRHLKNTVGRSKGMKRFGIYMCFGWGLPFLFVLVSVILDLEFGLYADDGGECTTQLIVPLYGHKSCYISEDSRAIFLFYPTALLMGINLIFASLTALNMWKHSKGSKLIEKKSSKHRRMFSVWLKLFVMMGISLMSEVIVWSLKKKNETLPWYLIFPDVISVVQAIAIFLLFACQPKIVGQLAEAHPVLRPFLDSLRKLPCYGKKNVRNGQRGDGVKQGQEVLGL